MLEAATQSAKETRRRSQELDLRAAELRCESHEHVDLLGQICVARIEAELAAEASNAAAERLLAEALERRGPA